MATSKKKTPVKKPATTKKASSSKSGPKNIDWYEARKLYLTDNTISFAEIAKIVGTSKTAVGNKAKAEDWTSLRQDLNEKAFNQFAEKLLDVKSQANSRHLQHWQNLQALANNSIQEMADRSFERDKAGKLVLWTNPTTKQREPIPVPLNPFALEKLAKTVKIAIDGERVVLGLPTSVSALSDPEGNSVWSGFADLMKEADRVIEENARDKSSGGGPKAKTS